MVLDLGVHFIKPVHEAEKIKKKAQPKKRQHTISGMLKGEENEDDV